MVVPAFIAKMLYPNRQIVHEKNKLSVLTNTMPPNFLASRIYQEIPHDSSTTVGILIA